MPDLQLHGFGDKYRANGYIKSKDIDLAADAFFDAVKWEFQNVQLTVHTSETIYDTDIDEDNNIYIMSVAGTTCYIRKKDLLNNTIWERALTGYGRCIISYDKYSHKLYVYPYNSTANPAGIIDVDTGDFTSLGIVLTGYDNRSKLFPLENFLLGTSRIYDKQLNTVMTASSIAPSIKGGFYAAVSTGGFQLFDKDGVGGRTWATTNFVSSSRPNFMLWGGNLVGSVSSGTSTYLLLYSIELNQSVSTSGLTAGFEASREKPVNFSGWYFFSNTLRNAIRGTTHGTVGGTHIRTEVFDFENETIYVSSKTTGEAYIHTINVNKIGFKPFYKLN